MSQPALFSHRSSVQSLRSISGNPVLALVDVLIIAVCIGIALVPVLPAYGTSSALYAIIAGILAGVIPVVVGAFARWRLPVTILVAFGFYVLVGGIVAYGSDLIWGFVPSGVSIQETLTGIVTIWKETLTLEPPLGQSDGVLLFPFLVAFTGSLLATFVVIWRKSWVTTLMTMIVVIATLIIAILWGTQDVVLSGLTGIILFAILMVWAAWRMRTMQSRNSLFAVVFISAVCGLAFAVSPLIESDEPRFVLRSIVVPPFDPRDQVSPLSQYRSFVKDQADTPLVTVEGMPEGALVRLATLDAYDGVVWSVSGDGSRAGSGAFRRIGERINQKTLGEPFNVTVTVEELGGVWTPTIGYLSAIDFEYGGLHDFRFNDSTGAAVLVDGVTAGDSYRLQGVIPASPSDEQLADAAVGRIEIAEVSEVPDVVAQEAISLSRDASTVALAVRNFQETLANRGFFSHGETSGGYPSLSGHGAARMADFFSADLMVGDAEQYASAMALLARSQGVPSRVVMGFVPDQGQSDQTFTGADMTAWVEIYYDDFGWVSYFPTPDESQTPQASDEDSNPEPEPEAIQQPMDPQPQVTPPAVVSEDTNIDTERDDSNPSVDWAAVLRTVAVVGIPLIIVLGVPLAIVLFKILRRRKRQHAETAASVVGGWQELLDHAVDLGIRPPRDATRREASRYIEARSGGVAVRSIADSADLAHFSANSFDGFDTHEYWQQVAENKDALEQTVPVSRRLWGKLSLASFFEQKRKDAESPYLPVQPEE